MPVFLPTKEILKYVASAYQTDIWGCGKFRRSEIEEALSYGQLQQTPYPGRPVLLQLERTLQREYHIQRIAYLVQNPARDSLLLQVQRNCCGFLDGNHRFAAALYRKDTEVLVTIEGCLNLAGELFGLPWQHFLEAQV